MPSDSFLSVFGKNQNNLRLRNSYQGVGCNLLLRWLPESAESQRDGIFLLWNYCRHHCIRLSQSSHKTPTKEESQTILNTQFPFLGEPVILLLLIGVLPFFCRRHYQTRSVITPITPTIIRLLFVACISIFNIPFKFRLLIFLSFCVLSQPLCEYICINLYSSFYRPSNKSPIKI